MRIKNGLNWLFFLFKDAAAEALWPLDVIQTIKLMIVGND